MIQSNVRIFLIFNFIFLALLSSNTIAKDIEINGVKYDAELIKELMTLTDSDYITKKDIERAGGSYKLEIEDFQDIYIEDMFPTLTSNHKQCKVPREIFRRHVREAFKAGEINESGHTFLRLIIINIPELDINWVCGTWGEGCYIIVHT